MVGLQASVRTLGIHVVEGTNEGNLTVGRESISLASSSLHPLDGP